MRHWMAKASMIWSKAAIKNPALRNTLAQPMR
jgi:hypothetical protein